MRNKLWILIDLVFLIIFNILFFVIVGTDNYASVWLSYGFIHFAYLMLVVTPFLVTEGKSRAVFSFALYGVSSAYFFLALIVGIVFIIIAPESYTVPLLVQLPMAGIYLVMLISSIIANEHTAEAEEIRKPQLDYVKAASAQLKIVMGIANDRNVKAKIEKAYDVMNSSQVKSHPDLRSMESQILTEIKELTHAVGGGRNDEAAKAADAVLALADERNTRLKNLNR